MADTFDVVARRIREEGSVIVGMIVWPRPGCAIVSAAVLHGGSVEGIDLGTVCSTVSDLSMGLVIWHLTAGGESQVGFVVGLVLDPREPEVGALVVAEVGRGRAKSSMIGTKLHAHLVAERLEGFGVELELLRVRVVRDRDLAVIDRHGVGRAVSGLDE